MKRRRDRILLFFAASFSLLAHSALLYFLMSLPIGGDTAVLFADDVTPPMDLIPISRAPDDLIIDESRPAPPDLITGGSTGDTAAGAGAGSDAAASAAASAKIQKVDPSALAAGSTAALSKLPGFEADTPDASRPVDPAVKHTAPPAPAVTPAAPRLLDASSRLLSSAAPSVQLPQFIAEADTVVAPTPVSPRLAPQARIDVAELRRLDAMLAQAPGVPASAGNAASPGGSLGSAAPMLPPAPGTGAGAPGSPTGKTPPTVAALTPAPPAAPMKLPEPPAVITRPATRPDAKPVVHLDEDFDYSLRVLPSMPAERGLFGPKDNPFAGEPGWFEVKLTPKRSLRRLKPLKKDVIYVLDTSESVSPAWVDQMRRGIADALETLNEGDRFNVVIFKENVSVLSPTDLLHATPDNKAAAVRFLRAAESSGWTDINRALGRLIVRNTEPDRIYQIIMLTDGVPTRGEVDAREIINLITRQNDLTASIFAVAVGDRTNQQLLEFLTYRNKGFVVYPANVAAGSTTIRDLAARLRYPVVKDAQFSAVGVDVASIFPRIPRDMYQGETVLLYGRYAPRTDQRLSMTLSGSSGAEILDVTFTLPFASASPADPALAQQWAFWKLHHLYSEVLRAGPTDPLKRQMDELKDKYKLKTAY